MGTVLLVQPDRRVRGDWHAGLEGEAFVVISVDNVDDAIACAGDGGIDLVVIDDVPAPALARLVAALSRLPDGPPFVLVSSRPDAPSISARLGATGFLAKPCNAADLGALLRARL